MFRKRNMFRLFLTPHRVAIVNLFLEKVCDPGGTAEQTVRENRNPLKSLDGEAEQISRAEMRKMEHLGGMGGVKKLTRSLTRGDVPLVLAGAGAADGSSAPALSILGGLERLHKLVAPAG